MRFKGSELEVVPLEGEFDRDPERLKALAAALACTVETRQVAEAPKPEVAPPEPEGTYLEEIVVPIEPELPPDTTPVVEVMPDPTPPLRDWRKHPSLVRASRLNR